MMNIVGSRLICSVLATVLLVLTITSCSSAKKLREHRDYINSEVLGHPQLPVHYLQQGDFRLHYRYNGTANEAVALWIHGTPGSWSEAGRMMLDENFNQSVLMYTIDRPGWGLSQNMAAPEVMPSFAQQSQKIMPLIDQIREQHPNTPLILAGHSLGGSLAAYMASQHPDKFEGLLLLAAALSPELSKPRWYHRLAEWSAVQKIIGPELSHSNKEMLVLDQQLSLIDQHWGKLQAIKVIVIQGDKDKLVSPANADFIEAHLPKSANNKVLRMSNQGHLLQMDSVRLIKTCIRALATEELSRCET